VITTRTPIRTAVVLAAGRGSRMRRGDPAAVLTAEQERAADDGLKAMMPVGAPFLDYVLTALADAGIRDVCLVVRPSDAAVRDHFARDVTPSRLSVRCAEQREPRGTADAVRAARSCVGDVPFLMLNADNYYPESVVRDLCECGEPGLPGFDAAALVRLGNISRDRIRAFALIRSDADGYLAGIVEKPDATEAAAFGDHAPVSMNLWAFPPAIFTACEQVTPSVRGELELADAVRFAMRELGVRFRVMPCAAGVLDISTRADVATVTERLRDVVVRL
jgi:glucose-1-phosphate thymidylyltransferase